MLKCFCRYNHDLKVVEKLINDTLDLLPPSTTMTFFQILVSTPQNVASCGIGYNIPVHQKRGLIFLDLRPRIHCCNQIASRIRLLSNLASVSVSILPEVNFSRFAKEEI